MQLNIPEIIENAKREERKRIMQKLAVRRERLVKIGTMSAAKLLLIQVDEIISEVSIV